MNFNSGCAPIQEGTASANSCSIFYNCAAIIDPNAAGLVASRGYTFGNLPTTLPYLRSPGYINEDFSIIKKTTLSDRHVLIFKADIPNACNRHAFTQLDGNRVSSTYA